MISSIKISEKFPDDTVWCYFDNKVSSNTINNLFSGKKIVLFSNPGLFYPSYIGSQITNYEFSYKKIKEYHFDDIFCLVHNDPYTVANYCEKYKITNIKFICDVNNTLSKKIGYLYDFSNYGLGERPWPFSCILQDLIIYKIFYEDFAVMPIDCYSQSSAVNLLNFLKDYE